MNVLKKDPYDMSAEELSDRYYAAKARRDWFNKWTPRIFAAAAGASVLAAGICLLAGAVTISGAISIICCTSVAGSLPMGLGSIKRDDDEMEMRRLSMANNTRIDIEKAHTEQAREKSRQELCKEFERIADHGGTEKEISVKGPLKLKLRDRMFASL